MSLPVSVQFVRNSLCVVKTFLPAESTWRALAFPTAAAPLNAVTRIEFLVALTQFAAVIFNFIFCYTDSIRGLGEVFRTSRLKAALDQLSVFGASPSSVEYTLLRHSLEENRQQGIHSILVGLAKFLLGGVFAFLTANSLHLRGPLHPLPVMRALMVLEVALAYFLFAMGKELVQNFLMLRKLNLLRFKVAGVPSSNKESEDSTTTTSNSSKRIGNRKVLLFATEAGFINNLMLPFKRLISPSFAAKSFNMMPSTQQSNVLRNDLRDLHNALLSADDSHDIANELVTTTSSVPDVLNRIDQVKNECVFNLWCTGTFFLLNFIAGYGYLLGILAFSFPKASWSSNNLQELLAKVLMLNMSPASADFWGNLAGDVAWSIEPLAVFATPWAKKMFFATRASSLIAAADKKKKN